MAAPDRPYHPIIYVRGFAATRSEIEETVADPYMGFNIGSTKGARPGPATSNGSISSRPSCDL